MNSTFLFRPMDLLFPICFILMICFVSQQLNAICCHASCECSYMSGSVGICGDCTPGTPYCATGSCNIFGCNCDGHCRRGTSKTCSCGGDKHTLGNCNPSSEEALKNSWNYFNSIDQDGDQKIHFDEFKSWADKHSDIVVGQKHFDKVDIDQSGFIEALEFDKDLKAAATNQWILKICGLLLAVFVLIGLVRFFSKKQN